MPKYVIGIVIGVLLSSAAIVLAGSMEPPSGPTDPASQMYTLEQIYNRLNTGAAATRMTTFTEPGSGPVAAALVWDFAGEGACSASSTAPCSSVNCRISMRRNRTTYDFPFFALSLYPIRR